MSTNERTIWNLDPTHSEIAFKVKHLMIANVKGVFQKVNAKVTMAGDDLTTAQADATIEAASIFTNEENRDNHLRGADFFDVEKHPTITFAGTGLQAKGDAYVLTGDLTIKGITKPVRLDVEYGGRNTDPWGNEKMAFAFTGTIDRKDWGLTWNAALETGGVLVSDEVRISGELEFGKA